MPCTRSCAEGESSWTVVVPGMRCRNWEILLLSEVARTVSMVVKMRSLDGLHSTRWMRTAFRALLILSLIAIGEVVRGVPSRLMIRRRSLSVGPFFGEGAFGAMGGVAAADAGFAGVVGAFFLPFLATWAQLGAAGVWMTGGGGGGGGGVGVAGAG